MNYYIRITALMSAIFLPVTQSVPLAVKEGKFPLVHGEKSRPGLSSRKHLYMLAGMHGMIGCSSCL